jgi:nicotinate-nucleotide adenylyltransferase
VNIALFGGTFDPIHTGHLQAARRAAEKLDLDRVFIVPSGGPPHKRRDRLTPFAHRFAMVTLACAEEPRFVPSLLEAPDGGLRYSIDTMRRVRKTLGGKDRLFFLAGLDAFLDVPQWKSPDGLLGLADFIVVSRPGVRFGEILRMVRTHLKQQAYWSQTRQTINLGHSTIHILEGVKVPAASREIRKAIAQGRPVTGLIPPLVEEYIMKEELYKTKRKFQR